MCTIDVVSCKISYCICVKLNATSQNLSPDLLLCVLFLYICNITTVLLRLHLYTQFCIRFIIEWCLPACIHDMHIIITL